jgi:polysaccharide pyruvyl transferase WcaK-like protein
MRSLHKLKPYLHLSNRWNSPKTVYLYCYISPNLGDRAISDAIEELIAQRVRNVTFKKVGWLELNSHVVDEINRTGDLFLLAGGGFYRCTEDNEYDLTILPSCIRYLKAIRIPMSAYALGFNRNFMQGGESLEIKLSESAQDLLRNFNSLLYFSSVRDQETVQLFNRLGINKTCLCPDPAMFLNAETSNLTVDHHKLNIGLNIANHGGSTAWMLNRVVAVVTAAVKKIEKDHSLNCYYFKHEPGEDAVINILRQKGMTFTVVEGSPRELLAAYKKMDIAVCQMMHAAILAFNALLPTVSIAYDIKHPAFADLIDKRELCLRGDTLSADDLIDKVAYTIENRKRIRRELTKRKKQLWRVERECLRRIVLPLSRTSYKAHLNRGPLSGT